MSGGYCQHGVSNDGRSWVMRRAERLFEIVQILRRSRGPTPGRVIAAELGASMRSLYRDMAALSAQGVPVAGEAGVGYVLEGGFDMPPLMLTGDELDAAVLGTLWVMSRGEPDLARAAADLLVKIQLSVPERLRPHVLEPAVSIAPVDNAIEHVDAALLRRALRARRKLEITYQDGQDRMSRRVVWPVLIGYRDRGRILAAWCELRTDFRYFRTDRMTEARILAERIPEPSDRLRTRWAQAMTVERERWAANKL
jgi:predicted DNA-binding transcriptional regulator YafY